MTKEKALALFVSNTLGNLTKKSKPRESKRHHGCYVLTEGPMSWHLCTVIGTIPLRPMAIIYDYQTIRILWEDEKAYECSGKHNDYYINGSEKPIVHYFIDQSSDGIRQANTGIILHWGRGKFRGETSKSLKPMMASMAWDG